MNSSENDALPSWHDGKAKTRIFKFLQQVTTPGSSDFVPIEDRIATFDNDGTLCVEKPILAQLAFFKRLILDADVIETTSFWRRCLNWFKNILLDVFDLIKLWWAYLYSGVTTDEYRAYVDVWIRQAKHPRYQRLYTDLAYQPMIEVLDLFASHGFTNYIVSGSTANFLRPWTERIYKVVPENIIGSSLKTRLAQRNGQLAIKLEPMPFNIDNGKGKVLSIERALAKRPIAAFGNSSGDIEMLRWARTEKQSLCMLIHHTDAVREYKYSPDTRFYWGKPTLKYAEELNWQVVDMKTDWKILFHFDS